MTNQPERLRIGVGGVVPVRWELAKAGDEPGSLTGWASVYNVVDNQDDVVVPGAFKKTLAEWRASQRVIPLTLDHRNTAEGVIGSLSDVADSAYGLRTTFKFASTPDAQTARAKAREGHLNGLSIFGSIINKSIDMVGDRAVQILREVALTFVGLTPSPANTGAIVTAAKSVVDASWDGSASRFTPQQWRASCILDTGQGDIESKGRYKLPVKEPNGDVNRNAVHAAAGGHGISAVTGVGDDAKAAAARRLVALYRNDLGEDPPAGLLKLAGMASASLLLPDDWVADMRSALAISVPTARKAAVDVLVAAHYQAPGAADADTDPPGGDDPATDDDDPAAYALALVKELPSGPSSDPVADLLASVGAADVAADLDALEAEIKAS